MILAGVRLGGFQDEDRNGFRGGVLLTSHIHANTGKPIQTSLALTDVVPDSASCAECRGREFPGFADELINAKTQPVDLYLDLPSPEQRPEQVILTSTDRAADVWRRLQQRPPGFGQS